MLAEHDRVVPVNEPQIGLHLAPFVSDWPGWSAEKLGDKFTFNRVAEDFHIYFFSRAHADAWMPGLRRMICRRFAVYGGRRSLLAIKEPNGSQAADVILRALPRSRLLFLLRDGRDVVDSELAATLRGAWMSKRVKGFDGIGAEDRAAFIAQAARKWLWRTHVVEEAFARHRGPKLLVRYEELLANPKQQLTRVFEWLRLDAREVASIVDRHEFARHLERGAQEFVRAASPGGWRQNLAVDEQKLLERILGPKLREVGYR